MIDNAVDFEDKLRRGIRAIYDCLGLTAPQEVWHKYLIAMPDVRALEKAYAASAIDMMQTYLVGTQPNVVRRIRQQKNGQEYLYFYTEKRYTDAGAWETEKPITQKEYVQYLMKADTALHAVHKTKYRFCIDGQRFEIDVYPFSESRAIMRAELPAEASAPQTPQRHRDYPRGHGRPHVQRQPPGKRTEIVIKTRTVSDGPGFIGRQCLCQRDRIWHAWQRGRFHGYPA